MKNAILPVDDLELSGENLERQRRFQVQRRMNDLFAMNGILLFGILCTLALIAWRLGPIAESNVAYADVLRVIAKTQADSVRLAETSTSVPWGDGTAVVSVPWRAVQDKEEWLKLFKATLKDAGN